MQHQPTLMEIDQIKRIVEAALLAAGQPLTPVQLAALFGENEPIGADAIAQALHQLQDDYATRGVELVEVASGFRFQVRHDVHAWVSRLWTERQTRYTRALLETLALIAYRQPITRAEIEQIRGVAVSTNIIKTLEEREWIRVVGHRDVPGKPALFGTTRQFLDYFNLKSLDQLPPLAEIRDIEDFEPQLALADMQPPGAEGSVAPVALDATDAEPVALDAADTQPAGLDDDAEPDALAESATDSETASHTTDDPSAAAANAEGSPDSTPLEPATGEGSTDDAEMQA
jgi:segregation and condensation protein B